MNGCMIALEFRANGPCFRPGLAIAARIMRRYLIDYSRAWPDAPVVPLQGLPEQVCGGRSPVEIAVAIDALLDELGREQPDVLPTSVAAAGSAATLIFRLANSPTSPHVSCAPVVSSLRVTLLRTFSPKSRTVLT